MSDATQEFFERLAESHHEPMLERVSGTLLVEVEEAGATERWWLSVNKGDIEVSRGDIGADCVARMDRATFSGMVMGQVNGPAAMLRGDVVLEGECWRLLAALQRLFPGAGLPDDVSARSAPAKERS